MSANVSLLDRAKFDLVLCNKTLIDFGSDDLAKDAAAYHLSQAVEKALKFRINSYGQEFPLVHKFGKLIEVLEELGECIPEWLIKNTDVLDDYVTKTRYSDNFIAVKRKIEELAALADELIKSYEPVKAKCEHMF
jgi:HEPN domain-containing protein